MIPSLPRTPKMKTWMLLVGLLAWGGCAHRHVETGDASWYGRDFRGKPTASGEIFRPNARRTAAHKTLPLGTVLVVKRLDSGQRVRVVVNDRGPYIDGRIIDLSKKAAKRIDLVEDGTAPVRVRAVGCRARRYDGCARR